MDRKEPNTDCLVKFLSVSYYLCLAQQTLVYQIFAFPAPCELPSSPLKSQATTPTSSFVFCQRARLCGGGERRTEYDRQLLQWPKHQELGGETQEGQTVVLKVQSTNKMFLCPKSKHFLAGKKLRFPVHLWNPMRKNLIPLFETSFVYQKDTITTPTSQSFHFLFLKLMQGPHYVHDESQSS